MSLATMSISLRPQCLIICILLAGLVSVSDCSIYYIVSRESSPCPLNHTCFTLTEISSNASLFLGTNVTLTLLPGNHSLQSNLFVSNASAFTINSYSETDTTSIMCGRQVVLGICNVDTVQVSTMRFCGCGGIFVSGVSTFTLSNSTLERFVGRKALVLDDTTSASIRKCVFQFNNHGSGNIMSFTNSTLEWNTAGVVHLKHSRATISQSTFNNNHVVLSGSNADSAVVSLDASRVNFIDNNTLVDNSFGSLLAYDSTIEYSGYTNITNCTAKSSGSQGATLYRGSAIRVYSSHVTFKGSAHFSLNRAQYGGALFAVKSTIVINSSTTTLAQPRIALFNNTATNAGGGIYLHHSTLNIISGTCFLSGNIARGMGGGIYALNSEIRVGSTTTNDSLTLTENKAKLGGGLYLEGTSKVVVVTLTCSIVFNGNRAEKGGAVYVDDYSKMGTCATTATNVSPASECFICASGSPDPETHDNTTNSILFYDNIAEVSGSNLFGGLLDRCLVGEANAITSPLQFTENSNSNSQSDGLNHLVSSSNIGPHSLTSITSEPISLCLCSDGMQTCSNRTLSRQVQKGQSFTVSVVAVDQVGSPIASARLVSQLSSQLSKLSQSQTTSAANNCTTLTYSVDSVLDSEVLSLYADGPCRDSPKSRLVVDLTFIPCSCPVGFERVTENSNTTCECTCSSLISNYTIDCDSNSGSFIKRNQSAWIGYTNEANMSTFIVANTCPFGFCRSSDTPVRINFGNVQGSDVQCSEGRTGILCGSCTANYSISLGSKRCIRCHEIWYLELAGIIVGSLVAGLGLAISIMLINFTVSVGTINGFIFYVNILDIYDSVFLPFNGTAFPELLIEWLNLNPGFDVCFIKGMDIYLRTWTRFLFPLYIILIVVLIIITSNYSSRFSALVGKRNPVATLATLLLLSYTSIVQAALTGMTPETIKYISSNGSYNRVVWQPDGNVTFFQPKHAILFLTSLILVVLTIAYKALIFSWQWVIRLPDLWILKWKRNQKLNIFVAAHQAPYCDQHRYWTGLLLLVRALLILTLTYTETIDPRISLLTLIVTLGVIFLSKMTFAKRVYKKWPVDMLELALMFNLFVFSCFAWYYIDNAASQRIVAYVSVTLTFILLLFVILYHIYTYVLIGIWPSLKIRKSRRIKFFPATKSSPTTTSSVPSNYYIRDRYHDVLGSFEIQPVVPINHSSSTQDSTIKSLPNSELNTTETDSVAEPTISVVELS